MDFTWLDVVLVLVLIGVFLGGIARGVWITVGSAFGFVVGAIGAFFAIPIVASWVESPIWRLVAVLAAIIVLVVAGHALGAAAGREIHRLFKAPAIRAVSSFFGGLLSVVVALFVIAALSFSVQAVGNPTVNQEIRESAVLGTIQEQTPDQVHAFFAQVRSTVLSSQIPEISELLAPEAESIPDDLDITEAATETANSVGRISGVAEACGHSQAGSGFAVSPTRVMTNAHVISGVDRPSVEMPDGQVVTGTPVYFDTESDVALLAVEQLQAAAVEIGEPLDTGDDAFVLGYPEGGPFQAGSALVQARDVSRINTIYGGTATEQEIYQINAHVRQGNSGGPLVAPDGDVVGLIFARAVEGNSVGFAMTADTVGAPLSSPDQFTTEVDTGDCTQR